MKSISILGCGWLGLPLGKALVKMGFVVSGSTTKEEKLDVIKSEGIRPYLINFAPSLNAESKDFFGSDIVIVNIPPRRKSGETDTFIHQIKEIVDVLSRSGTCHVLFISSTSVYPNYAQWFTEEDGSEEHYMIKAEELFQGQSNFKTTILRFGGLVGPGRHPGRFLSGKTDVKGKDHPVNIIHLDDCIAIIQSIIKNEAWDEIFNACADKHPTKKEFYSAAAQSIQEALPVFDPHDVSKSKVVSTEKLKRRLAYEFIFSDPLMMF